MNRRPRIIHGVIAAAMLAFLATVLVVALSPFLGLGGVIRLAAPLLGLAYLLYLFRSTGASTGRVVTLSAWCLLSLAAWWFVPSLAFYLLLHAGALWLVRSLYAYSGFIPALIDLALSAFAVATFAWAFMRTGSVFLATWCFFLVQALWAFIPENIRKADRRPESTAHQDGFERARRQADAALRQLFSQ